MAVLSGDFSQLLPVNKKSLATPIDDAGLVLDEVDDAASSGNDGAEEKRKQAAAEVRQGLNLWHSFTKVVSLQINIRAPGVLSQFLYDMR